MKTGTMNLPLHPGRAPRWLFARMVKLSTQISGSIIEEHGTTELLRRLSDPLWFQSFSCVLGFDWHSSGTTTTTMGALKLALADTEGIQVCGGKGATSLRTPTEIRSSPLDVDKDALEYASRMTAKVDNNCIQDSFVLYHHCIAFDEQSWAVVQQGMNDHWARRYHWFQQGFLEEHPIACDTTAPTLDLVADESEDTRRASVDLVNDNPVHLIGQSTLDSYQEFSMPQQHEIEISPPTLRALQRAYQVQPSSYEELVALKGVGASSLRALALTAELVYGAKPSWNDPVKYSFAHGGKDGFPYPVNRRVYDETIQFMRESVEQARLGDFEKKNALQRLAMVSSALPATKAL
jgi:hypothetical protein